jgi:hypothetical protein
MPYSDGYDGESSPLTTTRKGQGTIYHPLELPEETQLQDLSISNFSKEVLGFLHLCQKKRVQPNEIVLQRRQIALGHFDSTTIGQGPMAPCNTKRPVGRGAITKTHSKTVTYHGTQRRTKNIIKSQLQLIHHHLKEQMDLPNHETQETILQGLSDKHPRYIGLIRALPLVAKCIPDNLKKDLIAKSNSETMKLGITLMKRWSIWAMS